MDPVPVTGYCSYASPGKVVFRRFEPETRLKFGIMSAADLPRSGITRVFVEQLPARILELQDDPRRLTEWPIR